MLHVPGNPDLSILYTNYPARPAAANGTAVTAGSANVKGSWSELISGIEIERDCSAILINANSFAQSATARDTLLDIGIDTTGIGITFDVICPDLLISAASPYNIGSGGVFYYFPIHIPAGASVGARVQSIVASSSGRIGIQLLGDPNTPDAVKVGSGVEALGINTAASCGTGITFGTTTDGAWVDLGTAQHDCFFWQIGIGSTNTAMSQMVYAMDLAFGDATNKQIIVEDMPVSVTASEQINNAALTVGCYGRVPAGANLYMRGQSSSTAQTGFTVAAYGVR